MLPEIFCYAAGALAQVRIMLDGLVVHADAMSRDLHLTDGLVDTEAVMMALAPTMGREKAHDRLSAVASAVAGGHGTLLDLLSRDPEISRTLDAAALKRLVTPENYLGGSAVMVDRLLEHRQG